MEQVGDTGLGVLVLGAPEERIEGTHLNADPAVHAQRVVDVEAVEVIDLTWLATSAPRRGELLVGLDVDAPIRAGPGAEHAGGAVVLAEGDDTPGPNRGAFLGVGVLHGVGAVLDGAHERAHGDSETLDETGELRHQTTTFTIAVTAMLARDRGISTFHANRWSWSSRKRG